MFFVQPPEAEPFTDSLVSGHFLLYVFEFDTSGGCPSRDAFFDMIKVLDGVHVSAHSSVEALIAFFHTHDCGLILTGSGSAVEVLHDIELSEMEALSWAPTPEAPDPVERGMRLLGQGQMEAALVAFTEAYTQQNFRRVGYLGAAVVADQLGNDAEAETATVMGMQYFPADPAMAFHRALNRMRGGHYRQALVRLDAIEEWPNGRGAVGMLRALCLLADGQTLKGQQELRRLRGCDFRLDPHLERGVRWIRAQIWARDILVCIAACTAMAGLIGVVNGALWQGIWAGLGLLGVRLVMRSWKRQLVSQISGPLDGRMRLSSSAVLMDSDSKSVLQ